tara:strand:+ start:508 stop:894 length:387 start_codon:yes stop_codon:yes gene_type:complete
MKYIIFFLAINFCFSQENNSREIEIKIVSEIPFTNNRDEIQRFKTAYEVRVWSGEILNLVYEKIKSEPLISDAIVVEFIIYNKNRSRFVEIPILVSDEFIKVFKSEIPDRDMYIRFIKNTYEWILRSM